MSNKEPALDVVLKRIEQYWSSVDRLNALFLKLVTVIPTSAISHQRYATFLFEVCCHCILFMGFLDISWLFVSGAVWTEL